MALKTLPNNLEAEQSVLGSCFLSKYALQKASESLTEDSFYSEKNAKIFSSMTSLLDEKTPIDITTVTSDLKKKNLAKDIKLSGITCDTNKTYVKVIKFSEKYYYTGFIGCKDKNDTSGNLPIIKSHEENPETICDASSEASMSIIGTPESSNSNAYKLKKMTADIRTYSGISLTTAPKIWYGFSYNKDLNVIDGWDTLKYPGISSLTEEEQLRHIQSGSAQTIKSNKVHTPEGKTGDFY